MDYTGRICSVCGNAFKDEDDIVVCPECATPHHRECWFKNGKCVNAEKHSESFVWSASEDSVTNNTKTETQENPEFDSNENSSKICHICGSENPADTFHCGNCGALFGVTEEKKEVVNCAYCGAENDSRAYRCNRCGAPIMRIFRTDNPYIFNTGMTPDEPVAGVTANEASLYTQTSSRYYLKKFKKIDNKKLTFNWAAFFFAPYWFFYRKLYKAGIAALLIFISLSMLTVGIYSSTYDAADEFYATTAAIAERSDNYSNLSEEDAEILQKATEEFTAVAALPALIIFLVSISEKIICALIADKLYYNRMRNDLKAIYEAVPDKEVRQIMILKRGKASAVAFAASVLGEYFLISVFTTIADFISR